MSTHSRTRRTRHARSGWATILAPRPSERPIPWLRIRLDPEFAASYWAHNGRHWRRWTGGAS